MANNYQQFSEILQDITLQEKQWIETVLDEPDTTALRDAGINLKHIEIEDWPGFGWELMNSESDLWIYSEECGNIPHAGEFIRALLARHRPNASFTLTWSETCSKLRAGDFGGGGLFITSKSVKAFRAAEVVHRMQQRFERRQRK